MVFLANRLIVLRTTRYRPGEKLFNLIDFKSSHSIIELTPTKEWIYVNPSLTIAVYLAI